MSLPADEQPVTRAAWEQRQDESAKAYAAFKAFLDLGSTRSLRAAYRRHSGDETATGAPPGYFFEWSQTFEWQSRAQAFDRNVSAIERVAEEQVFASERAKWAKRQSELREAAWHDAEQLRAKAQAILALPLVEQVTTEEEREEDGRRIIHKTITNKPVRVSVGDAARCFELSDRLARLAAEMETDRFIVDTPEKQRSRQLRAARLRFLQSADLFPDEAEAARAAAIADAFGFTTEEVMLPPELDTDLEQ